MRRAAGSLDTAALRNRYAVAAPAGIETVAGTVTLPVLDKVTVAAAATGALIVTNDGELAARLMHPSSKAPKTYEVVLRGQVSAATFRRLREGGVRVSLRVPLVVRAWRGPVTVAATSSLGRADGG